MTVFEIAVKWSNDNSGFLTIGIFISTLLIGWVTGIFRFLRHKPKFKIEVIEGPSFCSTYDAREIESTKCAHRTAVSVYLHITNIGSAAAEIGKISVAYKSRAFKNPFKWYWLPNETICLTDFTVPIGQEDVKVVPFLKQRNQLITNDASLYLMAGESRNGISYFEQEASFGDYYPKDTDFYVKIKIMVVDSFGHKYYGQSVIPKVTLAAAQKWCNKFGLTVEQAKGINKTDA
jgi:hypothetical protein